LTTKNKKLPKIFGNNKLTQPQKRDFQGQANDDMTSSQNQLERTVSNSNSVLIRMPSSPMHQGFLNDSGTNFEFQDAIRSSFNNPIPNP